MGLRRQWFLLAAATLLLSGSFALTSTAQSQEAVIGERQGRQLLQAAGPATAVDTTNVTNSLLLLKAVIDTNGTLTTWVSTTSYCTWQGVRCNPNGQPVVLDLRNSQLDGQLPLDATVWAGLNSLQVIDLSGNNVTGYVPPQILGATGLQNLSLANNGFQGNLPSVIGTNMTSISFRGNQLTGGLPTTWANLTALRSVDVSNNQLNGTLPSEWSGLANARYLNFSSNNLSGQIPSDWRVSSTNNGTVDGGLVNLDFVGFGGNPQLCSGSKDGGNFIYPNAYNLPCSPPNVISLVPPPAPRAGPGLAPLAAPPPAILVPVSSPDAASIVDIGGFPVLLSPVEGPSVSLADTPGLAPGPGLLPVLPRVPRVGPSQAPVPLASAPGPVLAEAPEPASSLVPAPELLSDLAPVPSSAPGPDLAPQSAPAPAPLSVLAPVPAPEDVLALVPAPEDVLAPVPAPEDVLAPVPAPEALLAPVPAPEALLAPVPAPEDVLAPVPAPEDVLAPVPAPRSVLAPVPAPISVPVPVPAPISVPVPIPAPQPTLTIAPSPAPEPGPEVVPVPEPVAAPAPEELLVAVPAPAPESPTPELAPELPPEEAPVPAPEPAVVEAVPRAPAPQPPARAPPPRVVVNPAAITPGPSVPVTVEFNPGQLSPPPAPARVPTTGITTNITVTGATGQEFVALQQQYLQIIADITGQPVNYVTVSSVNETTLPTGTSVAGRRLLLLLRRALLQSNAALNIGTFVASADPTQTQKQYTQAAQNGSLRQDLQGIGLNLYGDPAVTANGSPASVPTVPVSGGGRGHSVGYYLAIILPTVLGGLLALILVGVIAWCCLKRSKSDKKGAAQPSSGSAARGGIFDGQPSERATTSGGVPKPTATRGGNTSLVEGLMFSHKPNPIFDTNETQSSRGDDYEVINLTNEATGRNGSGSSIAGMSGFSAGDMRWGATLDPPVGDMGPVPRLDLGETTSTQGMFASGSARDLQTRDVLSHPEGDFHQQLDSFTSAQMDDRRGPQYDSGISYRSAVGADIQRTAATNEAFVSPRGSERGSPRSHHSETSFNSAASQNRSMRTAGSFTTAKSAQTEFFDATSRGGSFDYDAFMEDVANPPVRAGSSRRLPPTTNPLYAQEEVEEQHPILDNPIFASNASTPRTQSPIREQPFQTVTSSGDVRSIEGHPITESGGSIMDSGGLYPAPASHGVAEYPITLSGGSIVDSGSLPPLRSAAGSEGGFVAGHPITLSGGSIMQSGGSYRGHPVQLADGSIVDSATLPPGVEGHPITESGGSYSIVDSGSLPPGIEGHPITFSGGSYSIVDSGSLPPGIDGHPITLSGGSFRGQPVLLSDGAVVDSATLPAGVEGHPITVSGGSISIMDSGAVPRGLEGHPITSSGGGYSIVDSGSLPPGVEGHPITFSGGSYSIVDSGSLPPGVDGHPITFSGGSFRGQPLLLSDGSIVDSAGLPPGVHGHPISVSGGSFSIGESGSQLPGVEGHPITFSGGSIMDSAPGSLHGHPVTMSGGSVMDSGAFGSARGHPVTMSGGSIMDSAAFGSAVGHPVVASGGSIVDSGGIVSAPGSTRGALSESSFGEAGAMRSAPGSTRAVTPTHLGTSDDTASDSRHLTSSSGTPQEPASQLHTGSDQTTPGRLAPIQEAAWGAGPQNFQEQQSSYQDSQYPPNSYQTPAGSTVTREVSREVSSSQQSSRSHQVFAFDGQHMAPEPMQQEGFHFSRDRPVDSEEEEEEIDHPHMRSSMDSERGIPFISEVHSPLGTQPGDISGSGYSGQASPYGNSVQGHQVSRSNLDSYPGSAAPASVQGHPLTGSGIESITGSGIPRSVQGHPVTGSDLGSITGSGAPESIHGYPITGSDLGSITGSGPPGSLHGYPITGSDLGSITGSGPASSIRGYPITGSDLGSITGSGPASSLQGYQLTGSGLGSTQTTVAGHPIATSNLGSSRGSITGHPVTGSSLLGSDVRSIHGHPVTSSGGVESLQGHPITGSSLLGSSIMGSNVDSIQEVPTSSIQGHAVTYSGGSDLFDSGIGGSDFSAQAQTADEARRREALHSAPSFRQDLPREDRRYGIQTENNPVYGTDASEGETPQRHARNPIFSSTGAFTSVEGGDGHLQTTQSDIWETSRGRSDERQMSNEPLTIQGHAINPMFVSTHMSTGDMLDEPAEPQGNPLFDSRRSPSSVGFTTDSTSRSRASGRQAGQENPLFNQEEGLMDTVDSMGAEQNPLYDSTTGQRMSGEAAQRSALFGSNILDSLETSHRESAGNQRSRNPLFESSNRTTLPQSTEGLSSEGLEDTTASSLGDAQQASSSSGPPQGNGRGRGFFSNLFRPK